MKLLVTGREGQLARSLLERARSRNVQTMALGRPDLDLTAPETLEHALDIHQPDFVINAAAYTSVDKAEEDISTAVAVNDHGAGVLASLCASRHIPILHVSTDYVYDGSKDSPYDESDPVNPIGVYGSTKLDGERAVISANPQHLIFRTAWVYSPFGNNFLKTMLRLAETKSEISVVDDQVGSPTYAPHLAMAILDTVAALHPVQNEDRWGIYHAAGAGHASWYQFACEIFRQNAEHGRKHPRVLPITSDKYPSPAKRPANSCLHCDKLGQKFGVRLPNWHVGVSDCLSSLTSDHGSPNAE